MAYDVKTVTEAFSAGFNHVLLFGGLYVRFDIIAFLVVVVALAVTLLFLPLFPLPPGVPSSSSGKEVSSMSRDMTGGVSVSECTSFV